MANTLGDLLVGLGFDYSKLKQGTTEVSGEFKKIEQSAAKAGKGIGDSIAKGAQVGSWNLKQLAASGKLVEASLHGVGNAALRLKGLMAGALVMLGISQASDALIGYNAKMEQTAMAYETMLGSAKEAQSFINDMKDFAAKTPFAFQDVDAAAKRFLAMGWAAKDVIPDLTAVGNAASALGMSGEGIGRITLALGQMNLKAKISGEEVRQLNEAGIGAQKYLTEAFKLNADAFDDLSKTGISGAQAVNAIINGMASDPKFANMMEKQSKTMTGFMSTIKDNAREIFGAMGTEVFKYAQKAAEYMADMTSKIVVALREGGIQAALGEVLGDGTANAIITVTDALSSLIAYGADNLPLLEAAIYGVAASWLVVTASAEKALIAQGLLAAESVLVTARLVAFALSVGAVGEAMLLIMGPVGWATLAIGTLTAAIVYYTGDKMMAGVQNASDFYAGNFDQVGNAAESAENKILNMTKAQQKAASGVRGEYEDMIGRKKASDNDKTRYGTGRSTDYGLDPSLKKGAAEKTERLQDKLQDIMRGMRDTVSKETDEAFTYQFKKVDEGIDKIKDQLAGLEKEGVDVSAAMRMLPHLKDYQDAAIEKKRLQELEDYKAKTLRNNAELLEDELGNIRLKEQESLAALNREFEDNMKGVQKGSEKEVALAEWVASEKKKIAKSTADGLESLEYNRYKAKLENSALLGQSNGSSQGSIDAQTLAIMKQYRPALEALIATEEARGEVTQKLLKYRKELLAMDQQAEMVAKSNPGSALTLVMRDLTKETANYYDMIKSAFSGAASAIESNFTEYLTGAQSFSDSFKNIFKSLVDEVIKLMVKMWMQATVLKPFESWFGKVLGSVVGGSGGGSPVADGQWDGGWGQIQGDIDVPKYASGGSYLGGMALVGEQGPELINFNRGGQVYSASQTRGMLSAGGNSAPIVNIINQTGSSVKAKASSSFDQARGYIIDVVVTALDSNEGGLRDAFQGRG